MEGFEERVVLDANIWTNFGGDGQGDNPANWSLYHIPQQGDLAQFGGDPMASIADCYGLIGSGYSVEILGGPSDPGPAYLGTVTFTTATTLYSLVINSGNIAQTAGADLSLNTGLVWHAGTLNANGSGTLHLRPGSTADISPYDAGSVTTGDTISFESDPNFPEYRHSEGTFNPGTVQFISGADLDIAAYCVVLIKPTPAFTVEFKNVDAVGVSQINIGSNGMMDVTSGNFTTTNKVPVSIAGGTLRVEGNSTATFSGFVGATFNDRPPPAGSASVEMSSGSIELQHGSTLKGLDGEKVKLSGGTLKTVANGNGTQPDATIACDLWNKGADVVILADMPNRMPYQGLIFGHLVVSGNVKWDGGTYRPVTYAPGGDVNKSDLWKATGTFTVNVGAAGAVIAPGAVDANGNPNTQQPAVGQNWTILQGVSGITCTMFPAVQGNWVLVQLAGNPVTTWQVQGKAAP